MSKPTEPTIVLVVVAHPDDAEFICGGSVINWVKAGATVHYLVCTDGGAGTHNEQLSSSELVAARQAEQRAAADMLGVSSVEFLGHPDGQLTADTQLKEEIVAAIRRLRPDTVVTFDPTFYYSLDPAHINHTDHRQAGAAAFDAVYPLARGRLSFPEQLAQGLEPHVVKQLLMHNPDKSNCFVDITSCADRKCDALIKHTSQYNNPDKVRQMVNSFGQKTGKQAGCDLAEGFVKIDLD